jgi:hypothetical protein
MKKLYTLFALVLMLAAMIAMPKKATASGYCPFGSSLEQFCAEQAGGYGGYWYSQCLESVEISANMYCQQSGVCCGVN